MDRSTENTNKREKELTIEQSAPTPPVNPLSPGRHWDIVCLALIVAIFVTLGAVYSITVPLWETPDEIHHFFFVKHLADGKGLPVQGAETRGLWEQEGSQPPLYYALGAALTFWIDTSDAEALLWKNPLANAGTPESPGNKNLFIHTERESWPWHGTALAMHLLRGLSLLMGAGTVVTVHALTRQTFPDEPWLAVAAAATCAFIPQFLFISSAVNNDNAITLLCTLGLWQLTRLIRECGNPRALAQTSTLPIFQLTMLGITLGLAALSKLSGLAFLALSGIVLAWIAWRRRSLTWFIWAAAIVFGLAAAIAGWWYLRNWLLYGDFTGLRAMFEVVGRRQNTPANFQDLWGEFRGLRWSFWALFGWFSIQVPKPVYYALDLFTLLALTGLVVWLVREGRKNRALIPLAALCLWLTMTLVSLIRWTSLTPGTQGRLLFPAIGAAAILLVRGVSGLATPRRRRATVTAWCAALLALAAWCPVGIIQPAYARPATITEADIPPHLPRLDHDYWDGKIRLLSAELDRQTLHPGETVDITLYWQALEPIDDDALLYMHLLGRDWELVGSLNSYPGWGTHPTSLWRPGEILRDRYQVTISPEAQAPTLCRIDVSLTTLERATGKSASDDDSPVIFEGQFKLVPYRWPAV
ncbi:MAG: phospholipid carrier-dependent glycosyltransferase, partial [Chloroflexota bacterium]|nr:phospholipid carrier-dependent glycosyltransferase [Chloroflexota bacterium]